jgi:LacI family transcriptional regulator
MNKLSMKALAKELGLSISTVSKAMKDSHEISTATKQRVFEMAKNLNYKPNPYAGSLKRGKSKTIGVVIPDVNNSYFSQAINGVESITRDKGYHMLIYLSHDSLAYEQSMLKDFQSGRVDGVIMSVASETAESNHIKELQETGVPVVFFDRICEDVSTAKITTDDFESCYKATQHLIENGCKRIALLSISKHLSISSERIHGYQKALKDHNMVIDESDIVFCSHQPEANYETISQLMKKENRPDGIIATVEELITNIYIVCQEQKISIPKDVKVISFTNLQTATIFNPSLTTITQPAFEMGKAAAAVLFKVLTFPDLRLEDESLVLPSSLIKRASTAIN